MHVRALVLSLVTAFVITLGFGLIPGSASAAEPLRLGAVFNLTGPMAAIDVPGLEGAQLAAERINAAGGVLGRPVQLVVRDGASDTATVAAAVRELVEQEKVSAVLGLGDSTYVLAAAPEATRRGVPFLTSGATLPSLPDTLGPFLFMAAFGDDAQAEAVALFAREKLKAGSAAVLANRAFDFTRTLDESFRQAFARLGGAVACHTPYGAGDTTFPEALTALAALPAPADVLFASSVPQDAVPLVRAMRRAGFTGPILSGDGFDTPLLDQLAPDHARGVYYATHVAYDDPDPLVQRFVNDHLARYGRAPQSGFSALGYDAVGLLADAVRRAGAADPAKVRDSLAATRSFVGVTGAIAYPAGSRVPQKPVDILGFDQGRFRFVSEIRP